MQLPQSIIELGEKRLFSAGETLFIENSPSTTLYLHITGNCILSQNATPIGQANGLLDLTAVLGGLPHTIRASTTGHCEFLCWSMDVLWQSSEFATIARHHLATSLLNTKNRLDALEAPIHYAFNSTQLSPGPFVFNNVTMVITLCEADLSGVRDILPDGLSLFRPAWRKRDALFIAFANFPIAYPDERPEATFSYTETTCFVPVRYKGKLGFFSPYIYPSTWEPILLGREIYGFPKQLGQTTFTPDQVALSVNHTDYFNLVYEQTRPTDEVRLIRAMGDWLGLQGRFTEVAFRIGDTLLDMLGTPLYRRVSVYNHKRIPAVNATRNAMHYDVNTLTQAVFSVLHWHHIAKLEDAHLQVIEGPLKAANPVLREAYMTQLNLRLSTGRVLRDYQPPKGS